MKKLVIFAVVIGAGWYWFGPGSDVRALMADDPPYIETENSGIFDVQPNAKDEKDIRIFSEPGRFTVIHLYDKKCSACRGMYPHIERLYELRPDVAIKLLHVTKNYYSIIGKHYGLDVPHVPFTVILDKQGEIIASDDGHENAGYDLFYEWLNAEQKRG